MSTTCVDSAITRIAGDQAYQDLEYSGTGDLSVSPFRASVVGTPRAESQDDLVQCHIHHISINTVRVIT